MSDFFDRLEDELKGAVGRGAGDRGRARPSLGGIFAVVASVAAVAVAVVAIAVIGHGSHGPSAAAPRARVASSTPGVACTRRLLDQLGVLRRPQTRADLEFRAPERTGGQVGRFTLVPRLTRLARTLPGGERVYLTVYAPRAGNPLVNFGDMLRVYVTKPRARRGSLAPSLPTPSAVFLAIGYELPPFPVSGTYVSVVPDGVARVAWTFATLRLPRVTELGRHVIPGRVIPGATLIANVQGNIAAVTYRHVVGVATATSWIAADGRVIKSTRRPGISGTLGVAVGQAQAHVATATSIGGFAPPSLTQIATGTVSTKNTLVTKPSSGRANIPLVANTGGMTPIPGGC